MRRNACPICGHREQVAHDDPEFIVCGRCGETLYPHELVRRKTRRTKRAYCLANFQQPT